jgi:predicted nuclease of restriction endonuclease-like (RecB) superfamily
MKTKLPSTHEYAEFVTELKQRIASARLHAARAVNQDLILLYWDIGRGIVERQEKLGWGQSVVEMLARDLQQAFPGISGFSARNLWDMRRFYSAYSDAQFVQQSVAEIPWGHHLQILNKVETPPARLFYLRAAAKLGWSRNVLLNQIKAKAYERSLAEDKTHNFPAVLPEYLAEQAEEALKSSYNLEFLGVRREVKERELEDRLIERLRDFILELGYGFCFIGPSTGSR